MTDVDYKVFENRRTKKKHLSIYSGFVVEINRVTVCGIKMSYKTFRYDGMNMLAFWRHSKRCKNCQRAAKR